MKLIDVFAAEALSALIANRSLAYVPPILISEAWDYAVLMMQEREARKRDSKYSKWWENEN